MKIALVTGIFPPDIGGPATYVPRFADFLFSKGHSIQVITLADAKEDQTPRNYRVTRFIRRQNKILRFIKVSIAIAKLEKETVIFANGLHEEVGFSLFLSHKKVVGKIVGDPVWERAKNSGRTILDINEFNTTKLGFRSLIQRKLLQKSLNKFNSITTPSPELCDLVRSWGITTDIQYIANGTKLLENSPKHLGGKEFDFISLSRLVPWKHVEKHIEVAKKLNKKLLVLGTGPEEKKLKLFANEIKANVTFLGEKPQIETREFLNKSKVFIMLSSYEGMSFALLEAMACGLPSVISDIPANLNVARQGIEAIVINDKNWESKIDELVSIFENEETYENFSKNARSRIESEFDEDSQFAKMENLLKP